MAKKNETKTKKSPFKTVSKNLPFYPDLTQEHNQPFMGCYVNSQLLGDDPDPAKQIPVYIFADVETGEEVFIIQSYAIKKAVEAAKREHNSLVDIVFNFEFLGKTTVNGKPFNQFNTSYCTMEEYKAYKELE